jgi:hypothetical protein
MRAYSLENNRSIPEENRCIKAIVISLDVKNHPVAAAIPANQIGCGIKLLAGTAPPVPQCAPQ